MLVAQKPAGQFCTEFSEETAVVERQPGACPRHPKRPTAWFPPCEEVTHGI